MDDIDRQLVGLLRDDARMSVATLARKLRVARGTVQNRLARLEGDGTIVGYCEVDDFQAALDAMQDRDVNTRWQTEMAPMFEVQAAPDATLERLQEIFHLD